MPLVVIGLDCNMMLHWDTVSVKHSSAKSHFRVYQQAAERALKHTNRSIGSTEKEVPIPVEFGKPSLQIV